MHVRKRSWPGLLGAGLVLAALTLATGAGEAPAGGKARLLVRLPADADLTIGTYTTTRKGPERHFQSPVLPAGKTFYYELKATWTAGGETKTATRKVAVRAGEQTVVDFNRAEAAPPEAEAGPGPKGKPGGKQAARSRTFLFTYAATVKGLEAGKTARVWLPVATS